MRSHNETEQVTTPVQSRETDPYPPAGGGERPSYGSLGKNGLKPHVGTTAPGPGEGSGSRIPALAIPRGNEITPTPALIMPGASAGARRNDSIDELIDGLPEEAPLPKKRTRETSGQDAARWDAQGTPFPGVTDGGLRLPAIIVHTDSTVPPLRKRKIDAPTFVTPQGHDLQVRRKVGLGVALLAVVTIVVLAWRWSGTSDLPVKPGVTNGSPTETMTSRTLGMPIATTTPNTTQTTTPTASSATSTVSSTSTASSIATSLGTSTAAPRASSSRVAPTASDSRIEHEYRLDR